MREIQRLIGRRVMKPRAEQIDGELSRSEPAQRSFLRWLGLKDHKKIENTEDVDERFRKRLALTGKVRLIVRGPAHAPVRTSGFGTFFPADTIHIKDSAAVVSADNCELVEHDHYHIRRTELSMESLNDLSSAAKRALALVHIDPHNDAAISTFQKELRANVSPKPEMGSPEADRSAAKDRRVTTEYCCDVQTGDGSVMCTTNKYVAEVTVQPLVDMLVDNKKLVTTFAHAVHQPSSSTTTSFYRQVVKATEEVDDLTKLAQTPGLEQVPSASLFSFFGFASVNDATSVMVGCHNELQVRTKFDVRQIREKSVAYALDNFDLDEAPGKIGQIEPEELYQPKIEPPRRRDIGDGPNGAFERGIGL